MVCLWRAIDQAMGRYAHWFAYVDKAREDGRALLPQLERKLARAVDALDRVRPRGPKILHIMLH
jgi:hypothetical protein